jgi:hypothetical protein
MRIHPLCAAGAVLCSLFATPVLAYQAPPDAGGPIATQAAVNTPPANQPTTPAAAPAAPASDAGAAAALRAAVFSGVSQGATVAPAASNAPQPVATTPAASPTPAAAPPAASAIATLGVASNATANVSQTTELALGLPVKDRLGVVIGQVSNIEADRKYGQLVTIQMGEESFRLPSDRFGLWGGAATINLTQADIEDQLRRKR